MKKVIFLYKIEYTKVRSLRKKIAYSIFGLGIRYFPKMRVNEKNKQEQEQEQKQKKKRNQLTVNAKRIL